MSAVARPLPPMRPPPAPADRRPRRRLAALLVLAAVLGGLGAAGLLAATGVVGGNGKSTTTVVQRVIGGTSSTSAPGLDARAVFANTAPGVVDITVRDNTSTRSGPSGELPERQSIATGAGFLKDSQGRIVTAAHLVENASSITVRVQDGVSRHATLLGRDEATDVAVLKIDTSGLTLHPLELGSSGSLDVGASVAAIGNPFNYERSISAGIVSGLDRTIEAPNGFTVAHAIQTDAALNPGNSGGPLLDNRGRVIGVVDQIATSGSADQSSGVGFAVPIDLLTRELSQLQRGKTVKHAYLGVSTSTAIDAATGALVEQVVPGGPAAAAGLKRGDVITAIDGSAVNGPNDVVAAIAERRPGETITLTVRRGSSTVDLTATLGTQPTRRSTTAG